jgi:hypothetical protein
MDPHDLDAIRIGGREPATFTIVECDARWAALFEELAGRIRAALDLVQPQGTGGF